MATIAPSHLSFNIGLPGPCEHKANIGCMMTALPCCCSCADKRPHATAYPMYVDGKGMVMKGRRWQRYCRKCYDFWQSLPSESVSPATPSNLATAILPNAPPTPLNPTSSDADMPRVGSDRPSRGFGHSTPVTFPRSTNERGTVRESSNPNTSGPYDPVEHRHRRLQNNADHSHPATASPPRQVFPLGTREDVQQEDYVSPIFGMFNRAWGRYRDAEEARQTSRQAELQYDNINPESQQPRLQLSQEHRNLHIGMERMTLDARPVVEHHTRIEAARQDVQNRFSTAPRNAENQRPGAPPQQLQEQMLDNSRLSSPPRLNPLAPAFPIVRSASATAGVVRSRRGNFHAQFYSNPFEPPIRSMGSRRFGDSADDTTERISAIDQQRSRPEPSRSEDLKVDFGCKSCQEQKIDSICLPCMHASMCHWCAEIWKDGCRDINGRFDRNLWTCPMCRGRISEVRRFYI